MEIGEYLERIRKFAKVCVDREIASESLIETPGDMQEEVEECLSFRKNLLNDGDEKNLGAYLIIGLFRGRSRRDRLACFAVSFEVHYEAELYDIRRQCEPYDHSQALFVSAPGLFHHIRKSPRRELIDANAVTPVGESEIYNVGCGYAKLTPYLNSGIVSWTRKTHGTTPTYIRLNPHRHYQAQPMQALMEACIVPPDPKWLQGFSLRKGMQDFARYDLPNGTVADGVAEFRDYHMRKIRRLEVRVMRREQNYLSMMMEELPREDDPNQLMVGRCIHLDTMDPPGTPLNTVTLKHLDLALNVYVGDDRQKRLQETLQHGKSADATFRTHIFRVEGIPFLSLFAFCAMFFRSQVLLNEWVSDLVGND